MWPVHVVVLVIGSLVAAAASPWALWVELHDDNSTSTCETNASTAAALLGPAGLVAVGLALLWCVGTRVQGAHTCVSTCFWQNRNYDDESNNTSSSGIPLTLCLASLIVAVFILGAYSLCLDSAPVVPLVGVAVATLGVCVTGAYGYKAGAGLR